PDSANPSTSNRTSKVAKIIANQLLKDNEILPQHLQSRKDAQEFLTSAKDLLEKESEELRLLLSDIESAAESFPLLFQSNQSLLDELGLDS
ncbi:MAG TPA: hypothetical protein DIU35_18100, partial [Candidatus Latescibacteria bacterium]|nr:hypothetical protein [Candidatus Latescibacterota bacterium]